MGVSLEVCGSLAFCIQNGIWLPSKNMATLRAFVFKTSGHLWSPEIYSWPVGELVLSTLERVIMWTVPYHDASHVWCTLV